MDVTIKLTDDQVASIETQVATWRAVERSKVAAPPEPPEVPWKAPGDHRGPLAEVRVSVTSTVANLSGGDMDAIVWGSLSAAMRLTLGWQFAEPASRKVRSHPSFVGEYGLAVLPLGQEDDLGACFGMARTAIIAGLARTLGVSSAGGVYAVTFEVR